MLQRTASSPAPGFSDPSCFWGLYLSSGQFPHRLEPLRLVLAAVRGMPLRLRLTVWSESACDSPDRWSLSCPTRLAAVEMTDETVESEKDIA